MSRTHSGLFGLSDEWDDEYEDEKTANGVGDGGGPSSMVPDPLALHSLRHSPRHTSTGCDERVLSPGEEQPSTGELNVDDGLTPPPPHQQVHSASTTTASTDTIRRLSTGAIKSHKTKNSTNKPPKERTTIAGAILKLLEKQDEHVDGDYEAVGADD